MGTYNFVFVILNSGLSLSVIEQFLVQFNSRWILQLIKGIYNDRPKLLRYFNGTAIFPLINTPSSAGFPKILDLYLKDDELFVVTLSGFPALGD